MYLSYAYWAAHTFFSDIQTKDEVLIPPYSRVTLNVECTWSCIMYKFVFVQAFIFAFAQRSGWLKA